MTHSAPTLLRSTFVCAVIAMAAPSTALAQEAWAVIPFEGAGVDADTVDTFTEILVVALREQGQRTHLVDEARGCASRDCALSFAASAGAPRAVFGSVRRLGERVLVLATVVREDREDEEGHRLTAASLDELDTVAERIAEAITSGRPVAATERLGTVLADDAKPDVRRQGDVGFALRLGGALPFGRSFGGAGPAYDIQAAFWFEASRFAIEARTGLRSAAFTGPRDTEGFRQVLLDVGGAWFASNAAVSPFFGAGAGLRYLYNPYLIDDTIGVVIITDNSRRAVTQGVAFGMYTRVGVMFMRTWSTRLSLSADWDMTAITVDDRAPQHLGAVNLAVHF